ncbi:hypothetical protein RJZ56_000881 [Blastomyces dermatitidis]
MGNKNPPDERVVYLALKNIFKGPNAHVRQPKIIRKLIGRSQNQGDVANLVKAHNIDTICNTARTLLTEQIFESTLKAKIRFPEVFDVSPVQSAEREASEVEAARNEANAIKDAVHGHQEDVRDAIQARGAIETERGPERSGHNCMHRTGSTGRTAGFRRSSLVFPNPNLSFHPRLFLYIGTLPFNGKRWPVQAVSHSYRYIMPPSDTEDSLAPTSSPALDDPDEEKFSEYLSSPSVPVIVGPSDSARTFHLHSRLLVKASSYFKAALKRDRFTEGQEQKVELEDVQPATFGFFIEWLYRDGWENGSGTSELHETIIPLYVRVYVLGERLFCPRMQDAAAKIIYKSLDEMGSSYSDTVVCDLLEIVETEMGYKASDDPLADRILWLAVQRLEKLQKFDRFASLLQEHQELAMHLCMRAGSKSWNSRRKSSGRFKQEGIY